MRIRQLFQGIEGAVIHGNRELEITGLSADSRTLVPGNLFLAKQGERFNGAQFIASAIAAGASAILTDLYDPFLPVVQIIHPHPGVLEPLLAARYYKRPSRELFLIGITGTKGKTTTSYLLRYLLEQLQIPTGLIGTVETIVGSSRFPSRLTTPDAIHTQKWLREMVHQGMRAAVLEVSSHGLEQGRVASISFDMALFTNLYPDHLDYHQTMERYAAAKAKLFHALKGTAIVNQDSPWAASMQGGKKRISFGIEQPCDIRAEQIRPSQEGILFHVCGHPFFLPHMIGKFNIYNALGAVASAVEKGASLSQISAILSTFPGVPGRLEAVPNSLGLFVFVDYAHNGEALANILQALRSVASQRLLLVFGCGGNRDGGRRAAMGSVAASHADEIFLTTDNPRFEDPEEIVRQILSGCPFPERVIQQPDRRKAIEQAIVAAQPGDIVLIAGKGHEKVQIVAHQTIPFDDVAVAKEALQNRASSAILASS